MRPDRPATMADPTGRTAVLERNYAGSTAPKFPAPKGTEGYKVRASPGNTASVSKLAARWQIRQCATTSLDSPSNASRHASLPEAASRRGS